MGMKMSDIGNELYQRVQLAKNMLFAQGELAQLTYISYEESVKKIREKDEDSVEISYPVGYAPDKSVIPATRQYSKEELVQRYVFLGDNLLAINGVYQLVITVESMLNDVLSLVVRKYPNKIGPKRTIKSSVVLSSTSIEELYLKTIDALVNELSYKSPREFACEFEQLVSVKLLECPAFHRYIEVKATRDIYIHNGGVVNEVYLNKSGTHAREHIGKYLPVNIIYFLESFEACLQITEWLERELHALWHSSDFESQRKPPTP
jgi:hypothetical protein